jgi:hypothetical protein
MFKLSKQFSPKAMQRKLPKITILGWPMILSPLLMGNTIYSFVNSLDFGGNSTNPMTKPQMILTQPETHGHPMATPWPAHGHPMAS